MRNANPVNAVVAVPAAWPSGHRRAFEATQAPRRPVWALAAVAGGLALLVASATVALAGHPARATHAAPSVPAAPAPSAAPFPTVGTASVTYVPGHSSGWHVHPGVHSVVVLSGTLTIYDEHCVRTDYGPGETYLGGNAPHLARNETTAELDVVTTYVYRATSEDHGAPVAAPAGCDVR